MKRMDGMWMAWKAGAIGEIDTSRDPAIAEPPSFYARRNCWYGASFPSPRDIEGRETVGIDRILWGNDYPHYEGCFPYSRENMRFAFSDVPEQEVRSEAVRLRPRCAATDRGEDRHHARAGVGAPRGDSGRLDLRHLHARPCRARDGQERGRQA
jgi:hypothetical protein